MSLDYLNCPKCDAPCSLHLEGYDAQQDRLRMKCSQCEVELMVLPADHPDRSSNQSAWRRLRRWWSL